MSASSPISLLSPAEEHSPPLSEGNTKSSDVPTEKENIAPPLQVPAFVYSVTTTKEYPWYVQDRPDVWCVGTYLDLEDARNAAWDQMSDRSFPEVYEEGDGGEIRPGREPDRHDCGTMVTIEAVSVHEPGSVPRSTRRLQAREKREKKAGKRKRTGKPSAGVEKVAVPEKKAKKGKRKEWELLAD